MTDKSKLETGVFDNTSTWEQAIKKMTSVNKKLIRHRSYNGYFFVNDGVICFNLCVPQKAFKRLLSTNYLLKHPQRNRQSKAIKEDL